MEHSSELELSRYLRSQRELATRLIGADFLAEAAPGFLATVADLLRWQVGALWEVVEGAAALRFVSGWATEGLDAEALWERSREVAFERGFGTPGRAWAEGEIVSLPDYREGLALPHRDAALRLGLSAVMAIPIPVGPPEEVLAVAEFHTGSFEEPSPEMLALLTGFADQLASFITRSRERAEAARVRQHMAEVVSGTHDAVMSKDLRGVVTSWNRGAERLYGYSAEEAIGRHISFLVPPDHKHEEMRILERVVGGERLETYETERIRADGARISVSLTVSQIRSPLYGVVGASVIARDVTAEKRRQRAQEFLVAASRLLDKSLDPVETARTIVATAVPELAELCVMDFVREDGSLGDSVVAGADPEAARRLERIRRESPLDPAGEHPVAQVLREERPM
ncbi:MAG TPA: PAS domain S-box protein, partial [Solirubrobacterales bacterium]